MNIKKMYRKHNLTDEQSDEFTFPHVMAMTGENLYSKAEIAEELGYRDMQIDRLKQLEVLCQKLRSAHIAMNLTLITQLNHDIVCHLRKRDESAF
jgi:hypothetical protein